MDVVLKAILDSKIEVKGILRKKDIEHALGVICYENHAECNDKCPVFYLNGHHYPSAIDSLGFALPDCATFKDGKKMLAFINKKRKGC